MSILNPSPAVDHPTTKHRNDGHQRRARAEADKSPAQAEAARACGHISPSGIYVTMDIKWLESYRIKNGDEMLLNPIFVAQKKVSYIPSWI